jgi:hypothetical protein
MVWKCKSNREFSPMGTTSTRMDRESSNVEDLCANIGVVVDMDVYEEMVASDTWRIQ